MSSKAVGRRGVRLAGLAAAAVLAAATASPALAQGTLTGTTIYSTSSTGALNGVSWWNTVDGDAAWNIYLSTSASGGTYLNPAGTLSTPLSVGTNTFYVFMQGASPQSFYGINLYLNGATTPSISGFTGANGGTLASNAGQTSINLDLSQLAAGPLSITLDGFQYTLTAFTFNTTGTGDFVSPFSPVPGGGADFVGSFVLTVTPTPEPGTVVLMASGLLGVFGVTMRRRRAVAA